jgi:hypothetical protein
MFKYYSRLVDIESNCDSKFNLLRAAFIDKFSAELFSLPLLLNITPRYLYSVHDSSWFGPK